MLKYTTSSIGNEEGIVSPGHHPEIDYSRRHIDVSAGSKQGSKMAIKKSRGGMRRILAKEQRELAFKNQENQPHLPPISTPGASPQNLTIGSSINTNIPLKRKEIRTPYVSHVTRVNDVATPYVLHSQITNIEPNVTYGREQSKLSKYSGNVLEYKDDDFRHDAFSNLQKLPTSTSPSLERRPRGRHGRKSNSFNEHDIDRSIDIKDLTVQSNQMGLNKRVERKQRDSAARGKADESFSIRKKIEQFRRWHEEQYREKIKKLKQEVDHQFEAEHIKVNRQVIVGPLRDTPTSKNDLSVTDNDREIPHELLEKMDEDKETLAIVSTNENSKPRSGSARTWRTWRHVNDSYAYSDVQKYIKENELMDDEKAMWIKKWIIEVNKAMKDHQPESTL